MYIRKRALKVLLNLCLSSSIFTWASVAFAINPGSELPIEIESDKASFDDSKGVSSYSGNVIITQGLSRLEADEVIVNSVDRKITTIEATGHPAHFVQQDSIGTQATHGYGNSILYLANEAVLKLRNNASLVQQENSFSGELIEYDILQKAIKAKGNETIGTRVKIQYHPHATNPPEEEQKQTVEDIVETPENSSALETEPVIPPSIEVQ